MTGKQGKQSVSAGDRTPQEALGVPSQKKERQEISNEGDGVPPEAWLDAGSEGWASKDPEKVAKVGKVANGVQETSPKIHLFVD